MSDGRLWKLPARGLRRVAGQWAVQSERGLGPADALFVPLRGAPGGGWQLALAPGASLALQRVDDQGWTAVPLPPGPGATHHLCLLRYDQPDGSGTRPPPGPPPRRVPAQDLHPWLRALQAEHGGRFERALVRATTAAAPANHYARQGLTFAFASCQYPAGMLDRAVAHRAYAALARQVDATGEPRATRVLLLGDQVYTDATYGLLDPVRLDDRYRLPYEQLDDRERGPLAALSQDWLARLRMTPDDHEIVDNWEPDFPGATGTRYRRGVAAYWAHQRAGETPCAGLQIEDQGAGWRLFMADSRTQRSHRNADTLQTASILGQAQTAQLEAWLLAGPPAALKIVTSAAMLLPRTRIAIGEALYQDGWSGYPGALHRLLAFACTHQLRNLVFLSGDAHLACSARVAVRNRDTGERIAFASHHAPALYAPYPFANERACNLALGDRFGFRVRLAPDEPEHAYECTVDSRVLAGGRNGVGLLHAWRKAGGDWDLDVEVLAV